MPQNWNIRSRSHECAVSGRPFTEGEFLYTAIYFDTATGGFIRRDVSSESWEEDSRQRPPFSFWRSQYEPPVVEAEPEIAPKESAQSLLNRLIEEDDPKTENARYILALMLERKRILSPTDVKQTDQGRMLFYENKKTGEVFVIRDPQLRLDEIEHVQEEVAVLLGLGTQAPSPVA